MKRAGIQTSPTHFTHARVGRRRRHSAKALLGESSHFILTFPKLDSPALAIPVLGQFPRPKANRVDVVG